MRGRYAGEKKIEYWDGKTAERIVSCLKDLGAGEILTKTSQMLEVPGIHEFRFA